MRESPASLLIDYAISFMAIMRDMCPVLTMDTVEPVEPVEAMDTCLP